MDLARRDRFKHVIAHLIWHTNVIYVTYEFGIFDFSLA